MFALLPNHCRYRQTYQKLSHNEGDISTRVLPLSVNFFLYINMGMCFGLLYLIKIFKMAAELCKRVLPRNTINTRLRSLLRNIWRACVTSEKDYRRNVNVSHTSCKACQQFISVVLNHSLRSCTDTHDPLIAIRT